MGGGVSMAADGSGAGGPAPHVPVMLDEVVSALQPGSGNLIVDGTFGAGGYSRALIEAGASVLAIDRDPEAIAEGADLAKASAGRLTLVQGRFGELDRIAREHGISAADGIVLDIGVSSMQLDRAERGFSFNRDGPLDMRMERTGPSAADVVNRAETRDLTRIIGILGEERQAGRIARAIAAHREESPYARTRELAGTIEKTLGRRPGDRIHPATRTFQALRIFVNRELGELADALFAAERLLRAGGRLAVVTFHSLEDRIVKQFFASRCGRGGGSRHRPQQAGPEPSFRQQQRSAMTASEAEMESNPRSRSAKLRFGERTDAPAMEPDMSIFRLPDLASADRFSGAGA